MTLGIEVLGLRCAQVIRCPTPLEVEIGSSWKQDSLAPRPPLRLPRARRTLLLAHMTLRCRSFPALRPRARHRRQLGLVARHVARQSSCGDRLSTRARPFGVLAWAHAPDVALAMKDGVTEMAQDGMHLSQSMHCSRTVFIRKADTLARGETWRPAASVQLALVDSSEKFIALVVNRELAPAAARNNYRSPVRVRAGASNRRRQAWIGWLPDCVEHRPSESWRFVVTGLRKCISFVVA